LGFLYSFPQGIEMDEIFALKEEMIKDISSEFKNVSPPSNCDSLHECFTLEDDKIILWFNVDYTTKIIERTIPVSKASF
jgi:hypothetical protein